MKLNKSLFVFIVVGMLFGCNDAEQNDKVNTKEDTLQTLNETKSPEALKKHDNHKKVGPLEVFKGFSAADNSFIIAIDTLSLGNNFNKVKNIIPILKGIRPEGGNDELASRGLTESRASLNLLEHPVDIEFNFKNDSLYSYFLSYHEDNFAKSEDVYEYLLAYYSKKYGECKKENIEEENHFIRNCGWKAGKKYMILNYNINAGIISWGYQKDNPF